MAIPEVSLPVVASCCPSIVRVVPPVVPSNRVCPVLSRLIPLGEVLRLLRLHMVPLCYVTMLDNLGFYWWASLLSLRTCLPTVLKLLTSVLPLILFDRSNIMLDKLASTELSWLVSLENMFLIRTVCNVREVRLTKLVVSDDLILLIIREVLNVFNVCAMFLVTLVVPLTWLWCVCNLLTLFGRGLIWPTCLTDLCRQLVRRCTDDLRSPSCLNCLLTVCNVSYDPLQVVKVILLFVQWLRNLCRCEAAVTCNRLVRLRTAISLVVMEVSMECGMSCFDSTSWDCLEVGIPCDRNSLLLLGLKLVLCVVVIVVGDEVILNIFRVYVLRVFIEMWFLLDGLLETSWTVSSSTDPLVFALLATVATLFVGVTRVE